MVAGSQSKSREMDLPLLFPRSSVTHDAFARATETDWVRLVTSRTTLPTLAAWVPASVEPPPWCLFPWLECLLGKLFGSEFVRGKADPELSHCRSMSSNAGKIWPEGVESEQCRNKALSSMPANCHE